MAQCYHPSLLPGGIRAIVRSALSLILGGFDVFSVPSVAQGGSPALGGVSFNNRVLDQNVYVPNGECGFLEVCTSLLLHGC